MTARISCLTSVSYTHLDVYKRQDISIDKSNSQDDKLHVGIGGMEEWCHWFRIYILYTDNEDIIKIENFK